MKSTTNIIGVILIIFGVICLTYGGITYTQRDKVAEIGSLQITSDTKKTIPLSPILGGISLVVGIGLILIKR